MSPSATADARIKHEAMTSSPRASQKLPVPFDIDTYLNPYIPRTPFHLLPIFISHFFGYRPPREGHQQSSSLLRRFHNTVTYTSIFVGTFCGLAIIENVFLALPPLSGHAVPIIIASFGAAAILEYNTIESPLAQPRNLVLGHFLSAVVAVSVTKLFEHLPTARFDDLRWLVGAISVGAASMLMSATKTVHPPAGATALLAATNIEIQVLGWWLLPLVLLASALMLVSAMLLNNLAGRRYPVYWWTPVDLKALREERRRAKTSKTDSDIEKLESPTSSSSTPDTAEAAKQEDALSDEDTEAGSENGADLRKSSTRNTRLGRSISYSSTSRVPHRHTSSSRRSNRDGQHEAAESDQGDRIIISRDQIVVPEWLELNDWEDEVLRILMERLRDS